MTRNHFKVQFPFQFKEACSELGVSETKRTVVGNWKLLDADGIQKVRGWNIEETLIEIKMKIFSIKSIKFSEWVRIRIVHDLNVSWMTGY